MAVFPLAADRGGVISVAFAASLSLSATSAFFIYLLVLLYFSRTSSPRAEWAKRKLAFLNTPFGVMFLNLCAADWLQALGFGLNYIWIARGSYESPSVSCSAQGFFIQIGDVASALLNLCIAVQTFWILTVRYRPPAYALPVTLISIWISTLLLAIADPSFNQKWTGDDPYYAWTANWCWISSGREKERLWTHYFWLLVSVFVSTLMYSVLFWRLRRHFSGGAGDSVQEEGVPPIDRQRRKALERATRYMLLYPTMFIVLVLPLSIYRLAGMTGHNWSSSASAAAGTLFTLAGVCDLVLFGLTRNILAAPVFLSRRRNTRNTGLEVMVVQSTFVQLDGPGMKVVDMTTHSRRTQSDDEDDRTLQEYQMDERSSGSWSLEGPKKSSPEVVEVVPKS